MSLRVCPIAPVSTPWDQMWRFLAGPENFALWWHGRTKGVQPVDELAHTLDVMTTLPFGIIIFAHVSCTALDKLSSQRSFGCEFSFAASWWAGLVERFASQQPYSGVAGALLRLKTAVEEAC